MARLFFILWIRSNIFRDFSGCGCSIFKCYTIIRFVFALAFQRRILNCSAAKIREDRTKRRRKVENDGAAFLPNLDSFKHKTRFLGGYKASDFYLSILIRFFFALAFQSRIPHCSTAKIREDMTKIIRKRHTLKGP